MVIHPHKRVHLVGQMGVWKRNGEGRNGAKAPSIELGAEYGLELTVRVSRVQVIRGRRHYSQTGSISKLMSNYAGCKGHPSSI